MHSRIRSLRQGQTDLFLASSRTWDHIKKMPSIQIYSASYCSYCDAAKDFFRQKNIPFEEIDVTKDPAKRAWLWEITGRSTVPQIFIAGTSIGGYTDLIELDRTGKLAHLLQPSG